MGFNTFIERVQVGSTPSWDTDSGITASIVQAQGEQPLTATINEVSTVANANDVVTMKTASTGASITIINNGVNTLQIFPASGDDLGLGVDTSTTLLAGGISTYYAYDDTNWELTDVDSIYMKNPADVDLDMANFNIRMGTGAVGFDGTVGEGFTFATNGSVTLGAGTNAQLILPAGSAAAPSIGWTDTGFYELAANEIGIAISGSLKWEITPTRFQSLISEGPGFRQSAASSTTPSLMPAKSDSDTGIGWNAADQLSLISGGKEMLRLVETGTATSDQLIIGPAGIIGSAATPSLAFGDGDTGFWEGADDALYLSVQGSAKFRFFSSYFDLYNSAGPRMRNEVVSNVVPGFAVKGNDDDTGLGSAAADQLSLISGGKEMLRLVETGTATSDQLIIGPAGIIGSAATPSLAWGDADTGFYESADDVLKMSIAGVEIAEFSSTGISIPTGYNISIVSPIVETVNDHGSVSSGTEDFDLDDGTYHTVTVGGDFALTFSGWPVSGKLSTMTVKLTNPGAFTITWPAAVKWPTGSEPVWTASGIDFAFFFTDDGGTTIYGQQTLVDMS